MRQTRILFTQLASNGTDELNLIQSFHVIEHHVERIIIARNPTADARTQQLPNTWCQRTALRVMHAHNRIQRGDALRIHIENRLVEHGNRIVFNRMAKNIGRVDVIVPLLRPCM